MNEATVHEIVLRRQTGTSLRAIAQELGISRGRRGPLRWPGSRRSAKSGPRRRPGRGRIKASSIPTSRC